MYRLRNSVIGISLTQNPRPVPLEEKRPQLGGQAEAAKSELRSVGCRGRHAIQIRVGLPMDFLLSFDGFETAERCRLIWRDGDYVGVILGYHEAK